MKSLIYREFLLYRKTILSVLTIFAGFTAIFALILLSTKYGNLSRLDPEMLDEVVSNFSSFFSILPGLLLFTIPFGYFEVLDKDFSTRWIHFQYASPFNEKRLVLAKLILISIMLGAAFIGGLITSIIFNLLCGKAFTFRTFALILFMLTIFTVVTILLCTLTCLFKKSTPAVITVFILSYIVMMIIMIPEFERASDNITEKELQLFDMEMLIFEKTEPFIPFFPIIILAVLAIGYLFMTMLLKRREK